MAIAMFRRWKNPLHAKPPAAKSGQARSVPGIICGGPCAAVASFPARRVCKRVLWRPRRPLVRPSRATAETELLPLAHRVQRASFHIVGGVGVRRREPAMPRQVVRDDRSKARRRARSASHGAAVRAAGGPARTGVTIAKRNAREKHCALADLAATRGPAKQSADVATVTGAVRAARADVMDSAATVATPPPGVSNRNSTRSN